MERQDEELTCMAAAMFEILKTVSARISEMERVEYLEWGLFFQWNKLMDLFIEGCGIQDEIKVQLMEEVILPGLENEITTEQVVVAILDSVRAYKDSST
ncbi:hypothetical protein [Paenibacillus senegalensis]|uniref:hypothetical protein n=1 Tax=Paenibacillus senegalensis TaxID=1465766 RepID=UPI000289B852|nr:hypothetical protein [Paenibacillus senegalensis]